MSTPTATPQSAAKKKPACPPPIPGLRDRSSLPGVGQPGVRPLAGRYRLDSLLGRGAMGAVFRAHDLATGSPCAIKTLNPLAVRDEDEHRRFANEGAVISHLFHPNVVEVRSFHRDEDGMPFLVMELLEGVDLHTFLEKRGCLTLEQTQVIVRQVASALHAAHSIGILHRDIKPRNIFLARQCIGGKETESVKVVDFGLAKIRTTAQQQTALGMILGTPEYLAPEGTVGRSSELDERSDQWALAVTAFRMLTDHLPFQDEDIVKLLVKIRQEPAPSLAMLRPDLPASVVQALERALSKRKEDRFPSILEFARDFCGPAGRSARPSIIAVGTVQSAAPTELTRVMAAPEALLRATCSSESSKPLPAPPEPLAAKPVRAEIAAQIDEQVQGSERLANLDMTRPIDAAVLDALVQESCVPDAVSPVTGSADYSLQITTSAPSRSDAETTPRSPASFAVNRRRRTNSWSRRVALSITAGLMLSLCAAAILASPDAGPAKQQNQVSATIGRPAEAGLQTGTPARFADAEKGRWNSARKRATPPLRTAEDGPSTGPAKQSLSPRGR